MKRQAHQNREVHRKRMGHTPCIPEHDPSVLLARRAEKLWVSRVPRNIIDLIAMSTGEQGCRSRLHLSFVSGATHKQASLHITRTLFSGWNTRTILSIPTAASFFPSQLQAMCVMACVDVIRTSRGRKAEKVGVYETGLLSWLYLSKVDVDTRRT